MDGTSMRASATIGTPLRLTLATDSGRTRSNAAANTTRVEDRNTVPTQPKNHSDSTATSRNCSTGLPSSDAARSPGYGHTPVGIVPAQNALLAALYQCQPNVLENSRNSRTAAIDVATSAPPIAQMFLRKSDAPRTSP